MRFDMAGWRLISSGVWFPPTKLNTLSTTPELVEDHPGRARVHRVVPKKPAHGIERAVYVVDTIINPDLVATLNPIFGHGPNLSVHEKRSAGNHDRRSPPRLRRSARPHPAAVTARGPRAETHMLGFEYIASVDRPTPERIRSNGVNISAHKEGNPHASFDDSLWT